MEVIIYDTDNINNVLAIEELVDFVNINNCYENFRNRWNQFNSIVLYEYYTFLLIMKFTNPDIFIKNDYQNWILKFDDLSFNQLLDNYILNKFFDKLGYALNNMSDTDIITLLKPIGNHLRNRYEEYVDIYSQDKYNLQTFHSLINYERFAKRTDLRQPLVLLLDKQYIGHIYCTNPDDDEARFIGIRESLTNTLNKLYQLPSVKGVGYILLTAIYDYIKYLDIELIVLKSPIGPMQYIAGKFGFVDDIEYNLENETSNMIMSIYDDPKINITKPKLVIL